MSSVFFIGDTHFGHKNIIVFDEIKVFRPFATIQEHNEELIKRWNETVKPKDTVFHLGDFCFGRSNIEIAGRLNGRKKLILGNHDTYPTQEYLKHFEKVYGIIEYKKGCVLSHVPVTDNFFYRWKLNIHGHTHHNNMPDKHYFNVSCENINLTPISFEEIMERIKVDPLDNWRPNEL